MYKKLFSTEKYFHDLTTPVIINQTLAETYKVFILFMKSKNITVTKKNLLFIINAFLNIALDDKTIYICHKDNDKLNNSIDNLDIKKKFL